jgi:TatD DNase family protein
MLRDALLFLQGAAWRAALDLGFYLSMSGIAAFPKSQDLRDIFATAPLDRILLETDSPYLAPPPHRGQAQRTGLYRPHRPRGAEVFRPDPEAEFAAATSRQFRPPVRQGRAGP